MTQKSYYWAGDRKIPLDPSTDWIAVDFARMSALPKGVQQRIGKGGQPRAFKGMIHLVSRRAVPDDVYAKLDRASAILPVYRHGDTLLVAFPEVRVEAQRTQRSKIRSIVEQGPKKATITGQRGETVVLRPVSGRGVDAIALANTLYETVHPRMAQARFVRIVPRPDPRRRAAPPSRAKAPGQMQPKRQLRARAVRANTREAKGHPR